jgi:pimeloyl-ACP methyl ester carboxylesterase
MLVNLDPELTTSAEVESVGALLLPARIGLVAVVAVFLGTAIRWVRDARLAMRLVGPARPPADGRLLLGAVESSVDPLGWPIPAVARGRPLANATWLATALALGVGLAATAGLALAADVATARLWRWVAGADAAIWVVASILLGSLITRVAWRVTLAARAVGVFADSPEPPQRLAVRLVPALLLLGGLAPIAATPPPAETLDCPTTTITCAIVTVPVFHGRGPTQPTIRVEYAVHHAVGRPSGALFIAVGGPGASGLASAEAMLDGFGRELVDRYDIVFWDQCGIGRSDGHNCPIAGGIYSAVEPTAESAGSFVDACLREAGVRDLDLRRYATTEAAEDIEAIRAPLGVDRIVLYGESYGSELAQAYAAVHPDRLAGLILDGPVDLTLSSVDFWAAAAHSFDDTLAATFRECSSDPVCRSDLPDPAATYASVLGALSGGPITVSYADFSGTVGQHAFTRAQVEGAVASLMYEPSGRALALRAIAAAAESDFVPLAQLADLFGPGIDVAVSTFAYHAILCADYRVSPTADPHDADAVIAYGRETGALDTRMATVYFAQLPCLYWPVQPDSPARPTPITTLGVPIFVLGAELDPITPIQFGRQIAARAANGYLVESSGGPHVTFGRGNGCVDELIDAFLLHGILPTERTTRCTDVVTDAYIGLTDHDVRDFDDALDAAEAFESELFADPLYSFWSGPGQLPIACRFGGVAIVTATDDRDDFTFDGCEFADGMVVDGSGTYDYGADELSLDITFADGSLHYTSGAERVVTGTFRGRTVDERD